MFNRNDVVTFTPTSRYDTKGICLVEGPATIAGPVHEDDYDKEEVGQMYIIVQVDGMVVDCFEDELSPIKE